MPACSLYRVVHRESETRAKISTKLRVIALGRPSPSAETRAKISKTLTGTPGQVFTQERRDKIGAKHRGKVVSAETRAKMSAAGKRRVARERAAR